MKIRITDECISCQACVALCPEYFEMGDDKAVPVKEVVDPADEQKVRDARDACPVQAIKLE